MPTRTEQLPLEPVSTWRWRRRQLRNLALGAAILVAIGHTIGVPHLRWEYTYRGPRSSPTILSGVYIGPTGVHRYATSDRNCSLILLLKPERPLWGWLDFLTETTP